MIVWGGSDRGIWAGLVVPLAGWPMAAGGWAGAVPAARRAVLLLDECGLPEEGWGLLEFGEISPRRPGATGLTMARVHEASRPKGAAARRGRPVTSVQCQPYPRQSHDRAAPRLCACQSETVSAAARDDAMAANWSSAAWRSSTISAAITSGAGRLPVSSSDSSRSQKMSRDALSLATSSS